MYSLSDLTIKTIRELNKNVKIYAFFPKGITVKTNKTVAKTLSFQQKHGRNYLCHSNI